ncbi:hypothetical protein DZC73_27730 [Albitalea terrae]|uniref:Uncharacterized protein n=1 Tax=Piscinibacter terrae TaxID=2496871 RepID=A0A3N7HJJ7_9BURK|nr:hypothetical protein DZC73_27730 [Albitalea terrae]
MEGLGHTLELSAADIVLGQELGGNAKQVIVRRVVLHVDDLCRVEIGTCFGPKGSQSFLHGLSNLEFIKRTMRASALRCLFDELGLSGMLDEPNSKQHMRRTRDVRDEVATVFRDEAWHGWRVPGA